MHRYLYNRPDSALLSGVPEQGGGREAGGLPELDKKPN
jgi:hypothetical protein